ncbi:hypothetical protein COY07_00990 [Candidatus Peregrinibacteria bacterium CG_4_10_14_0_2_um_filter_43_11]|nr:MAG: hypothetical protein COY07_00990 [Candidatus Peregrinibacteria bacterium CG_4_10_14_0_2_um_filter_43_11]
MTKKILFLTDHYFPYVGGAELLHQKIAEFLVEQGWTVDVVTTSDPGRRKKEVIKGVTIHGVAKNRYLLMLSGLTKAWSLSRDCDVIQTTTYNAGLIGWIIGRLRKKPTFLIVHELLSTLWFKQMNPLLAGLYWCFERLLIALPFTHYIAVSKFTESQLLQRNIQSQKITVIPHGIDQTLFRPENRDPDLRSRLGYADEDFILLFFGRPGILKGAEFLVKAMKLGVSKNVKLLMLLSAMPASGYHHIKKLASGNPRIQILDSVPREKLPHYLNMANAVVVPSLQEGFGFSAVEACVCNRPVIVSHAGALPEVVFGKVIFTKPGDVTSLSGGIEKAMRGEWEQFPKKEFLWKNTLEAYLKLYNSI